MRLGDRTDGFQNWTSSHRNKQGLLLDALALMLMCVLVSEARAQNYVFERLYNNRMQKLVKSGDIPGKATLLSPSGNISTSTPAYSWNAVSSATWYQL